MKISPRFPSVYRVHQDFPIQLGKWALYFKPAIGKQHLENFLVIETVKHQSISCLSLISMLSWFHEVTLELTGAAFVTDGFI